MLRALFEHDVRPDLVLGTSVGRPQRPGRRRRPDARRRSTGCWSCGARSATRGDGVRRRPAAPGRRVRSAPAPTCTPPSRCARRLERGVRRRSPSRSWPWSSSAAPPASSGPPSTGSPQGPVVPAVMASAAVPGLLPPARVGEEHYLDGGIVNSIPLGRAVAARRRPGLRAPGRPHRPAADGPAPAVGGRPGLLRDRPPAPLRARAGRAARRRRGARAARRRVGQGRLRRWPTATPPWSPDASRRRTTQSSAYLDEHLG